MDLKTESLKTLETRCVVPRDLGEGLVMRLATAADRERYPEFAAATFGNDHFDEQVAAWLRDFIAETHPAGGPSHVLLVEDTRARYKIVSTTCFIPQTWTYAGIPFGVGRPEAVCTDPAYRRRGLVRAQFEYWHAQSAAMGHLVQGITGIPWYYRQFGYEYAIHLGGVRVLDLKAIPILKEGEEERFRLRPMTLEDVPFVAPLYERECARWMVACPRPEWLWRHLLTGYSPLSHENRPLQIIETADGRAVGYVSPSCEIWKEMYHVNELAVVEGQSLRAVMPSTLRALKRMAEAEGKAQNKPLNALFLSLGREHPAYDAIPELLAKRLREYGWYVRVEDVPGFLRHVAPALETRLAQSPMAGHSGELKISEYRAGCRIRFENGRITTVDRWAPEDNQADARFPPLSFLQLIFGYKSLHELRDWYADCWAKDEADVLLSALFPKQGSVVIPVG